MINTMNDTLSYLISTKELRPTVKMTTALFSTLDIGPAYVITGELHLR